MNRKRIAFIIALSVVISSLSIYFFVFRPSKKKSDTSPIPPIPDAVVDVIARRELEKAFQQVQQKPEIVRHWAEYGYYLHVLSQKATALAVYRICQQMQPEDSRWPYLQSVLLLGSDIQATISLLKEAEKNATKEYLEAVMMRLADCYTELSDYERAQANYERVLQLNPQSERAPYAKLGIAVIHLDRNELPQAERIILQLENDTAVASHALKLKSQLWRLQGKVEQATKLDLLPANKKSEKTWNDPFLRPVYEREVGKHYMTMAANDYVRDGEYQKAIDIIEKIVVDYPEESVYLSLSEAYFLNDEFAKAEAIIAKVKATNQKSFEAENTLGMIAYIRGEYRWAEQFKTTDRSEYEKAIDYFQKSIALKPEPHQPHLYLALSHCRLGQLPQALKHIDDALQRNKDSCEVQIAKAYILLFMNRRSESQSLYKQSQESLTKEQSANAKNRYRFFNDLYQLQLKTLPDEKPK